MTTCAAATTNALPTGDGWPVASSRPLGCLPMAEAIRRAINSEHYTGSRNKRAVWSWCYRLAQDALGGDPSPAMYDGSLWIPAPLHPALSEPARQATDAPSLKSLPEGRRNRALAKHRALLDFKAYTEFGGGRGLGKCRALARFVQERATTYTFRDGSTERSLSLSESSMLQWERKLATGGLDALAVDGRGQYGRGQVDESAAAMWDTLRGDPRKFKLSSCWRQVSFTAKQNGWRWFEALSTCRVWDKARRNERGLILNQRGELKYAAKAGPYLQPDPKSFEPGECWELDHSTLNVWCRQGDRVFRPVVTLALDWRSRAIVGHRIILVGNQESVLLVVGAGGRAFGLPSHCTIDNGKDFSSFLWTGGQPKRWAHRRPEDFTSHVDGVFSRLGITPRWAMPYSPNSKGRVERVFGTLDEVACKHEPSYCGNRPDDRPESHADLVAKAVDFDEFKARFARCVEIYNDTPHSGEGMDGRTPRQIMALATRKRVLSDDQATYLLAAWPRPVEVGRQGVAIRIAGHTVRFGAFDRALQAVPLKTPVRVAYDPDDLSAVNVWHVDGRFICRAAENHQFDRKFATEELRTALREKRRAIRVLREARRTGLQHFASDPVEHAIAATAADAARRRKPDPPPPAGGTVLVPIQTPFETPPKEAVTLRKAVGAPDAIADMNQRMAEFAQKCKAERKSARGDGRADLIKRLAESAKR